MSPHQPEDWPDLFAKHLNAGDLAAAVALYEPDARFVPPTGETIVGRDAIRPLLAQLIARQTHMAGRVLKTVTAGDIAMLHTDWQTTTAGAAGQRSESRQRATEILRQQPDGAWRLLIGHPNARD